jgi:hypothetical protein
MGLVCESRQFCGGLYAAVMRNDGGSKPRLLDAAVSISVREQVGEVFPAPVC